MSYPFFRPVCVSAAFALALAGCATLGTGSPSGPLASLVEMQSPGAAPRTAAEAESVREFYRARTHNYSWIGDTEKEADAAQARAILSRAYEHGLSPDDYRAPPPPAGFEDGPEAAQYDIALTRAVLRYANDVRTGRVAPGEIYNDVDLPSSPFDAAAELNNALERGSLAAFFTSLPPPHPEYRSLMAALSEYRAFSDENSSLAAASRVALDQDTPERTMLVARLEIEDAELAAITEPSPADIRAAVRRFQSRNRLSADGIAGPNTLTALRAQSAARMERVKANMERWRWVPREFEARHIAVNVPEQALRFVRDGETVLTSRVIVGRESSTTPILRTTIASVKANPPWNIPGDIAARDLLPYMRRNPNYLAERNMVLVDTLETDPHGQLIDWREVEPSEFFYRVRQLPGPDTALGDLMLDMPNDFDVYLHDTPAKNLFTLDDRTVSNGCVRVQEIYPLASLALTGDAEAGMERIHNAIETRETQYLDLETPLPVYLLYWTAVPSADGTLSFPPDRYGRDQALIRALNASYEGQPAAGEGLVSLSGSGVAGRT